MAVAEQQLKERQEQELAGLDALETVVESTPSFASRLWAMLWPKVMAIVIVVGGWQLVVMSGWKPEFVLPSPFTVFQRLWDDMQTAEFWTAINVTMQRAVKGYALALIIGVAVGLAVSRSRVLRAAVGSLITGLQTMPSVAWFPLAILLFKLTDAAIMFVIVLGAAPVDRQRPHPRRRPRATHHAAGRAGAGGQGLLGLSPRHPARRSAVVHGRAQAGLGLLLAQPDGRRAAGHHRQPASRSASCWPPTVSSSTHRA